MTKKQETDRVVEQLIEAVLGTDAGVREKHILRESLRGLVRLAKAEQLMDVRNSVNRLTGALEQSHARRRAKAVLLAQRLPGILEEAQRRFEFN
ncbi:hypothetical protein E4K72_06490 [Oxalobacteraceae bacterium OM1]|nr:hypothetical protein E4K72_06490 [Oxalobacteraceae bacterium OM1]